MADKEKKQKKMHSNLAEQRDYDDYKNAIPEDEIWTFQVEGLQPPHVHKDYKNAKVKKIVVVAVLLVAISLSIYMSVRVVHNDKYKYELLGDGTYELIKYSNPGEEREIRVDYVDGDKSKPVTVLHEYAFNCDEKITELYIGRDVKEIDGKAIYSCYALKAIHVDPENKWFCDVNGVLFDKDVTTLITYPIDHDLYLREKFGYDKQLWPEDEGYDVEYAARINTYFVPKTVKTIGKLAFNYSELFTVYLPEGLKTLETMAFFRNWHLCELYTYEGDFEAALSSDSAVSASPKIKKSLPDSLEYIGSDCFNSAIELDYMYIPASVREIGHHAFWGACRNEDGGLIGISQIDAELDEATFKAHVKTGDQWTGQYDKGLFFKSVPVVYSQQREA